jgi:hypothetical protein
MEKSGIAQTEKRRFRRSQTFGAPDGAAEGHSPQKRGRSSRKVIDLPHIGRQSRKSAEPQKCGAAKVRNRKSAEPQKCGTAKVRNRKSAELQKSGAAKEPKRLIVQTY